MLASLLSRPCTSSTAKLSVVNEAVPLDAPFSETVDRSISPSRSAIDICREAELSFSQGGLQTSKQSLVPKLHQKQKHL